MVELPRDSCRVRVNGALMNQYVGRPVCVLGTVMKADGGGTAFQMKASDGALITVRLENPITEPLSGLIEVYGVAQGKGMIVSGSFTMFPEAMGNCFDLNAYNEALKIIHSIDGNPLI